MTQTVETQTVETSAPVLNPKQGKTVAAEKIKQEKALRNCKATIYCESPDMMIPKRLKHAIMPRNPEELGTAVGHVFFGITDEKGVEKVYGLHACYAMPGAENLPKEDQMPFILSPRKVKGAVIDDSKEPYDDKLVYHITQKQYDKIRAFADKSEKNPPKYNILTSNCVVFAYEALKKADLRLPPQLPVYTPAMTSLGIRVIDRAEKIKQQLGKAAANILANFSTTRKLSANILENLRKPPIREGHGVGTLVKNSLNSLHKMLKFKGR